MIRRRGHRAGFTMIELMISLVISSLLVGMILSIFTRMSTAYRTQQHVAELQQVLTAAQEMIQRDVRQAGFQMSDGVRVKGAAGGVHSAVEILDDGSGFGPDELHVFYADRSAQAKVKNLVAVGPGAAFTSLEVDNIDLFQTNDVVVLSYGGYDTAHDASTYEACVVQIQAIAGNVITLRTGGTWGDAQNDQCDALRAVEPTLPLNTMLYRFKARGYRIDPTRRALAVLQMSPSGGLVANDWQDMGIGFTDLQIASRWYEGEDVDAMVPMRNTFDTPDLDTDPVRDWYSGADQNVLTGFRTTNFFTRPLLMEVRVSLVVRTSKRIDAVGTAASPAFIDTARPSNNDLGNRAAVVLAGVADAARPEELRGDALFRYSTVGSDTRNLSVGR